MYENIPMYHASDAIKDRTSISCVQTVYNEEHVSGPLHWHDYYSLDIITDGSGTHSINGKHLTTKKGDLILTTPTDIHNFQTEETLYMCTFLFTDSVVDKKYFYALKHPHTAHLTEDELRSVLTYFSEIKKSNEKLRSHPDDSLETDTVKLNLSLLLILLAKKIGKTEQTASSKISDLLQYLNMHFREPLTVERVAKNAGLTPAYFSTWFKKNVGMSFVEYINSLRIDYAVSMIKQGHTIIDSCYASGFGSLSHFNHTFKSKLGVSPREYK